MLTVIDVPQSLYTVGSGINPQGDIVGYYGDSHNVRHGFLVSHGTFIPIDVPGASFMEANGINPQGDIVGDYVDSDNLVHGFLLGK